MESWRARAHAENHITLGTEHAAKQLKALLGKPVVVWGSLQFIHERDNTDRKIFFLGHFKKRAFPVVVFDPLIYKALDVAALSTMFIEVSGELTTYRDRPQIVINSPTQIRVAP